MTQTQPPVGTDIAWMQQAALLSTTLTRIARYAELMQDGLSRGELDIGQADLLGRSVLTVLREAAAIGARAEYAARSVA